jgi:hypothetical protein
MSSVFASIVGLAVYIVVLLPLLAIAVSRGGKRKFGTAFIALILAVAAFQTGILQRSWLAPTDMAVQAAARVQTDQCGEIVDLMRKSGLTIDRSDPSSPKLAGSDADQIPAEVAEILIRCHDTSKKNVPSLSQKASASGAL